MFSRKIPWNVTKGEWSKLPRFGVQQISFCSSFYWWSDWAANASPPNMGHFQVGGGSQQNQKLQVVSQKNERLKPENGGGFLGKGYSFWNPFIKFQISFLGVYDFRFWLKQNGGNGKKAHQKTASVKKKIPEFWRFSGVGGGVVRCSCFRYQLKYGLKNVAMFLVGSLSFRESWGQKIMKTRRYYFPHGSPWPGCCWQLNTFLLVWLVLKSSNIVYWELWEESWCHVTSSDHETKVLVQIRWLKMGNFWLRNSERIFVFAWSRPQMAIWKLFFRDRCPSGSSHIKSVFDRWNKTTTTFGMFTTIFSPFWNFQGYITRALNQGNKKHRKERIFMMLKTSPTTQSTPILVGFGWELLVHLLWPVPKLEPSFQ